MAEEATREALLQLNAKQAAQIALLIQQNSEQTAQIKLLIKENARLKKRIEQLERQVKRYVAPHSRETLKADPKPPGRRAGQGTFSFKAAPARDTVTRIIDVEPANIYLPVLPDAAGWSGVQDGPCLDHRVASHADRDHPVQRARDEVPCVWEGCSRRTS